MRHSVLLVDDEESIRHSIELYLREKNYDVETAARVDEGLEKLNSFLPHVLLVDLKMPDKDGFCLIEEARKRHDPAAIIVISGHGDVEKAVRATKMGVYQFLEKPFSLREVEEAIEGALSNVTCWHHLLKVSRDGIRLETPAWTLIGVSDSIKDIYRKILMVSRSEHTTVLIEGESGTGKELVARAVFENSRPRGEFIDVNCAALSESLLEAELFGYEKGSFTGATRMHQGLFEAAEGGAIFLDEVGEMPIRLQSKLLRVLEEKSFKRVGGVKNIQVSLRVIASTNKHLPDQVEKGEFRRDLFYRLNVFTIGVDPLRKRPADIPVLGSFFLKRYSQACKKHFTEFTAEALERLTSYQWPGNVRELRNVIERAVILGSGSTVHAHDLMIPDGVESEGDESPPTPGQPRSLANMERELIREVLEENDWQKARSAEILGINRTTLWHKIKRYGLDRVSS